MFTDALKFTVRVLLRKPVRGLLTVLQVSLGIAAVALVLNVLMYPEEATEGPSFISADERLIEVTNGVDYQEADGVSSTRLVPLFTPDDLDAVREVDGVVAIPAKQYDMRDAVELEGMRYLISGLRLVNEDFMDVANLPVVEGTTFSAVDFERQSRTLVISQQAAHALFGDQSPIGRKLVLTRHISRSPAAVSVTSSLSDGIAQEFEIIGVMDVSNSEMMPYQLRPEHFMAPLGRVVSDDTDKTTQPIVLGMDEALDQFMLIVKKEAVDSVKQELVDVFTNRYGSRASLIFRDPYIPSASRVDKQFGMFLGGFALVGLIVSSIGILSVMMVSVVERMREIGLRRAVGASRRVVVVEILVEAGLLAAVGALVGLVAASFAAGPLSEMLSAGYATELPEGLRRIGIWPAAVSLCLSVLVGLVAGLLPAVQASRHPAVDSLRDVIS